MVRLHGQCHGSAGFRLSAQNMPASECGVFQGWRRAARPGRCRRRACPGVRWDRRRPAAGGVRRREACSARAGRPWLIRTGPTISGRSARTRECRWSSGMCRTHLSESRKSRKGSGGGRGRLVIEVPWPGDLTASPSPAKSGSARPWTVTSSALRVRANEMPKAQRTTSSITGRGCPGLCHSHRLPSWPGLSTAVVGGRLGRAAARQVADARRDFRRRNNRPPTGPPSAPGRTMETQALARQVWRESASPA